jgi:hypothetical protein
MKQIYLSELRAAGFEDADAFAGAVTAYVTALTAHQTEIGTPAPTAHVLVEHAVGRVQFPVEQTFQPMHTYERQGDDGAMLTVTEPSGEPVTFMGSEKPDEFRSDYQLIDDTPPPPTLDERKMALIVEVDKAANEAVAALCPPLKQRLMEMTANRAYMVEEDKRTPAEVAAIATSQAFDRGVEEIRFRAATLAAQIHDLTEDTIGSWKPSL